MNPPTPPTPGTAAPMSWDQRYDTDEYIFGTEPNAWLAAHRHLLVAGQKALCVADGEGRNSVWLARQGLAVDAFDPSAKALDKARRLAGTAGVAVNFMQADCDSWRWPAAHYEVVAAIFVQFADPPMRQRLFEHIKRCLKPGGHLLLIGYGPKQLEYGTGGPKELSHLYTADLLRQAFADFDALELDEFEADLQEGERHAGRSALVGMVARKPA